MSWINKLNFEQSIKEIKQDEQQGNDFCLDPLRFEDLSIKETVESLENIVKKTIEKGQFSPLIEIDIPKSNYILRPGARPNLIEWVAYNAIVNFIGSQIYKQIPDVSFSFNRFREKFKKKSYKRKIDHWIDFEKKSISLSKKFNFLLITDIVSFFENISLEVLRDRLVILSENRDYQSAVNFLINNILSSWSEKSKVQGFGLPQGPTASTVLADIYLYPVDREMRRNKILFIRYMDDIRVYAKTRQDLKKNMIILVRILRELKLNLNAKKTFIYETTNKKAMEKVFDPNKQTLNLIDRTIRSSKKDQIRLIIPSLLELFELSKDPDSPFSERYLKFFISHMIDLMRFNLGKKSYIKKISIEFLKIFKEKHHLSDKICWFLVAASQYHRELGNIIKDRLIEFVLDKDKNIYNWQEMWILDTIRQIGGVRKRELDQLKKHVSQHELCQAQLCLIRAENGSIDEKEENIERIKRNRLQNDQYRYYFLSAQELPKILLKKIERKIPEYFRNYVYNIKSKKYGFKYYLGEKELISEYLEYY